MKKLMIFYITVLINVTIVNAQCWRFVSSGNNHTVAIKSDGTLWAWGTNYNGQLGNGIDGGIYLVPIQIGSENNWESVEVGSNFSLAIKTDGTLWGWGNNVRGQLGDGTTNNKLIPTQIGTSNTWSLISAGWYHVLAIKSDGTLWTWGYNDYYQLGDGNDGSGTSLIFRNFPKKIGVSTNWSKISAGLLHSVAIKTDGTLWAWGGNSYGQIGNGTNGTGFDYVKTPTQIGTSTNWSKIGTGNVHTVAIKTDGSLWGWGRNANRQLGDGTSTNKNIPTPIGNSTDWTTIEAGFQKTFAIKTNGTLWNWGNLTYGTSNVAGSNPTQIGIDNNWSNISTLNGSIHSIKTDGSLWAWGINNEGQIGDNTTLVKYTPVMINCSYLGIREELDEMDDFLVFPNPANEILNIQNLFHHQINNLHVLDATGKIIIKQMGSSEILKISNLKSGLYYIKIESEGKIYITKFLKK